MHRPIIDICAHRVPVLLLLIAGVVFRVRPDTRTLYSGYGPLPMPVKYGPSENPSHIGHLENFPRGIMKGN